MSRRTHSRNAFETNLDGSINNSQLTFVVDSSTGLTDPVWFCIDPESPTLREFIKVTNISGLTWTITRGEAGSAAGAQAHDDGILLRAIPVHQHLEDIFTDIEDLETADTGHFGGTDTADHPESTPSVRGFISAADKTKLNALDTADQVTGGDSHDHVGGDGAQIDHGGTGGLSDDDHPNLLNVARHDSDDHSGFEQEVVFTELGTATVKLGTVRYTFRWNVDIMDVFIRSATAVTGSNLEVDVNKNGITIFTTQTKRPIIPAGNDKDTSDTPDIVSFTADTDYLTIDIDAIGSSAAGSDLVIQIKFKRT